MIYSALIALGAVSPPIFASVAPFTTAKNYRKNKITNYTN